jgi:hypothetical protein
MVISRSRGKVRVLIAAALIVLAAPILAQFIVPGAAPIASAAAPGKCPAGDVVLYSEATITGNGPSEILATDMTVTACVKATSGATNPNNHLDQVVISAPTTTSKTVCTPDTPIYLVEQDGANTNKSDQINKVSSNGCVVASLNIATDYFPDDTNENFVAVWLNGTDPTNASQGSDIMRVNIDGATIAKAQKAGGTLNEGSNTQQGKISNTGSASHDPNATCETGGFGLNWILCPVFNATADFCDWMFQSIIQPFLRTSPISTNQNDTTFKIWSQFRVYGNVMLVIGLLVLVFGQSIGGGLIDAYTVKKSMPRILIAAILINLSIYIVAGLVDITNVVGGTLGSVMTAPLNGAGAFNFSPSVGQGLNIVVPAAGAGILAGVSIAAVLSSSGAIGLALAALPIAKIILLTILMPVVLGLLAAFLTLILRKAILLALILVSPIAFAMYCLPNTEKYFKKWWDFLIQTLMVYPIVVAIFAVADILSVTVYNANRSESGAPGGGTVALIVSFVLQFLPLLLIPYAFRLAGGLIGTMHETFSNYRKRGQEAIKGNVNNPDSLRNKWAREAKEAAAGSNLSGRSLATRFNPTTLVGRRRSLRKSKLEATRNTLQAHYGKQGTAMSYYEQNKDDSNITSDLALYGSSQASRQAIENDITGGKFARDSGDHQQRLYSSATADLIGRTPAMRRRALLNPSTIGYGLAPGEAGWDQASEAMRSISGGDEGVRRSLVNEFQYLAKSAAGRPDLAAAVDGGTYNGYRAWTSVGLFQHAGAKPADIKGSADYFSSTFDGGRGSEEDKHRAAVFYRELKTLQGQSSGGVRDMADAQRERLENEGIGNYLAEKTAVRVEDRTASGGVRQVFDPSTKTVKSVADPTAQNGFRMQEMTQGDRATSVARGFDQVDPNRRDI